MIYLKLLILSSLISSSLTFADSREMGRGRLSNRVQGQAPSAVSPTVVEGQDDVNLKVRPRIAPGSAAEFNEESEDAGNQDKSNLSASELQKGLIGIKKVQVHRPR